MTDLPQPRLGKQLRILVIDDDLEYCEKILKVTVENLGHTLEITNNFNDTKQKLEFADQSQKRFDIAIIDMNLGTYASRLGNEISEFITHYYPYVGCILLSGERALDPLRLQRLYGFDDYISKLWFDVERFREALDTARQRAAERVKAFHTSARQQTPQDDNPASPEIKGDVIPRTEIFISYSHDDLAWMEKLEKFLKPLLRNQVIHHWVDKQIPVGAKWRVEIEKAIARAKVAVLLVSANFLASDFITERELPPILEAAEKEGLTIVWIPIGSSSYKYTFIKDFQAASDPQRPLNSLSESEQQKILVDICDQIAQALK
jgi:CheY-like chemotaxis protein